MFYPLCNTQLIFSDLIKYIKNDISEEEILLITSHGFSKRAVTKEIINSMPKKNIYCLDSIKSEPTIQQISSLIQMVNNRKFDLIIALGGGSVIDTAKILSVLLLVKDKTEIRNIIVNHKKNLFSSSIPIYAFPTTAGSGAELTPFATIWDKELKLKYSLESRKMIPKIAVYDHKLLKSIPKTVSISSGLDTISHALESTWNLSSNPITLLLSSKSLELSINSIRNYSSQVKNEKCLKNMQLASIFAGIAISHTKTGLSHSISYPLTSIYNIPHGIASSLVLPELLLFNSSNDDGRLSELSINLKFSSVNEFYQELLSIRSDLLRGLDILETIKKIKIEDIAHKIITAERAKLNIKEVSHVEASEILERAIKSI